MDVVMPQLGETVVEGTLTVWHKKEGEEVKANEVFFEIGTDKVEMEVPAPVTGVVKEIRVGEGETVKVGAILAVIEDEEASIGDAQPVDGSLKAHETFIGDLDVVSNVERLMSSGRNQKLSPVVRRLLAQHNLNSEQITGTGRGGRITKEDVLEFIDKDKPQKSVFRDTLEVEKDSKVGEGTEVIPFNRMRQVTAEHMVRSKATSPHVHQGVEVDFLRVERVRKKRGAGWKSREGFALSFLPFIARAVCDAVIEFPKINALVNDDKLVVYDQVNLAIAVDLNFEGLVAPVIKNASAMTVVEIARTISKLASKARSGTLQPEDYQGATYTISNNGSFGTLFTTPIINQPQVAILSTDVITKRPIVIEQNEDDFLAIRPVGIITQAFDHRAIDGGYAAAFLNRVKQIIESKDWDAVMP